MVMLREDAQGVPAEALERLRCPRCTEPVGNDGGLVCRNGHALRVKAGFIDASAAPLDELTARTLTSFGYEHSTFVERGKQQEAYWRYLFPDDVPWDLERAVGLDAGCGSGRFSTFLAQRLRAVVALDGSIAARSAAANLSEYPNAVVVRSDLRAAPFAPGSFDFISCIGVLHHLDDAQGAFRSLAGLLAPGGRIVVFVYSKADPGSTRSLIVGAATAIRRLTVHLPPRLLRVISAVLAVVLFGVVVAPGRLGEWLGIGRLSSLPLSFYRRMPMRSLWLSVFDVLSAPLERRYTWPEIEPWFMGEGLRVEAVRDDHGLIVMARRLDVPAAGSPDVGNVEAPPKALPPA